MESYNAEAAQCNPSPALPPLSRMQPGWESAPQSSKLFRVASRFVTGLLLAAAFRAVCQQGAPPEQDFLRAIAAHPRDPHTRGDYGIFLQQQGRAAEAIAQF